MIEYKLKSFNSELPNTGYAQEGYESILPFNSWLALSKIKLNKDITEYKTFKLSRNATDKKTEEFFKFVDDVRADNGFKKMRLSYDENGNAVIELKKEYSRRLTDEELGVIYVKYANTIIKDNLKLYSKFLAKEEAIKAKKEVAKLKDAEDYKTYLALKKRFENEKI